MTQHLHLLGTAAILFSCQQADTCPGVSPLDVGDVGCAWGYAAGLEAGRADAEVCEYGRTPIPDPTETRGQDAWDLCAPLIGSGQTGGECLQNVEHMFLTCAPGGYSIGYHGEAGEQCVCDSDTGSGP